MDHLKPLFASLMFAGLHNQSIGPLHDPVTWCKITHAGEQVAQWDFQNKGKSRWTGTSCIVLEVPLCNLHPSMCDFAPCDRIVQRAYRTTLYLFYSQLKSEAWCVTTCATLLESAFNWVLRDVRIESFLGKKTSTQSVRGITDTWASVLSRVVYYYCE